MGWPWWWSEGLEAFRSCVDTGKPSDLRSGRWIWFVALAEGGSWVGTEGSCRVSGSLFVYAGGCSCRTSITGTESWIVGSGDAENADRG